jgi:hypothetical protein
MLRFQEVLTGAISLIAGLLLVILSTLPASSESIELRQSGGVYMLPVRINDTVTVPFVLDSGAAEVALPNDVFLVLRRSGTITDSDYIGNGTYTLAGGATVSSDRYVLHKMSVGGHVVTNVVAHVVSVKGDPLLGQSFLQRLPAWTLDNVQHALVLHDDTGTAGEQQQTAVRVPPRENPFAQWAPRVEPPTPPGPLQQTGPMPTMPSAPVLPTRASLQDIFKVDMLNVQVPFLESHVGVARRVFNAAGEQGRTYVIDGCDVTAYLQKKEVVAYSLVLGGSEPGRSAKGNCNIDIPTITGETLRTNDLTIGKFINVMGTGLAGMGLTGFGADPRNLFRAVCITSCGNASDPTVEFHWDGPLSSGLLKIDLISTISDSTSIDAAERWKNLITKAEGETYVINAKYNCDERYQKIGLQLFRDVQVNEIIIRSGDRRVDPFFARLCGRR